VSPSSVTLSEVDGAGFLHPIDPSKYSVAASSSAATDFVVTVTDATYPLKFGQRYQVKAATSITDSTTGKPLTAEGCTPGSGNDCSDSKVFTTVKFTPKLTVTAATGVFKVTFNYPVDPASVTPYLSGAKEFQLYQVNADGSVKPQTIPITCTLASPSNKVVTCTPNSPLSPNTLYKPTATFYQTAQTGLGGPAIVSPTVGTPPNAFPTDQSVAAAPFVSSGHFFGTVTKTPTATFTTPCP
jgi:hypothetical protein